MTDKLLGIIAINLTIITGLMVLQSIPTATAQSQSSVQKIALCEKNGRECLNFHSVGSYKQNGTNSIVMTVNN